MTVTVNATVKMTVHVAVDVTVTANMTVNMNMTVTGGPDPGRWQGMAISTWQPSQQKTSNCTVCESMIMDG